jgi:hypothetical protein
MQLSSIQTIVGFSASTFGKNDRIFPVFFPVSREMASESGSLRTLSSAIQSNPLDSLAVNRREIPGLRG